MSYIPSDLISVILGKLPINERYKHIRFNKEQNRRISHNKLVKDFYLVSAYPNKLPDDETLTNYCVVLAIATKTPSLYNLVDMIRYMRIEMVCRVAVIKNNIDLFHSMLIRHGVDFSLYGIDMPREFVLVMLDKISKHPGSDVWPGLIPPILLKYPDLIEAYKNQHHSCIKAHPDTYLIINKWICKHNVNLGKLWDRGVVAYAYVNTGALDKTKLEEFIRESAFKHDILSILDRFHTTRHQEIIINAWEVDLDRFRGFLINMKNDRSKSIWYRRIASMICDSVLSKIYDEI